MRNLIRSSHLNCQFVCRSSRVSTVCDLIIKCVESNGLLFLFIFYSVLDGIDLWLRGINVLFLSATRSKKKQFKISGQFGI